MDTKVKNLVPTDLSTSYSPVYGQAINVRPIRPEDLEIETQFVRELSAETRYNRLFSAGISITPEWLERLTRIDYSRDMALVSTVMLDDREVQIGVARYVLLDDDRTCEFAIAIADAWQGCGIGRTLMLRLIESASAAGLKTMVGDVLTANTPMLHLVHTLGFAVGANPDGAELRRVTLQLAVPAKAASPAAAKKISPKSSGLAK